jgi:hypothetical protein
MRVTTYILETQQKSGKWQAIVRSESKTSIEQDAALLRAGGHTVRIVESDGTQQEAAARSR